MNAVKAGGKTAQLVADPEGSPGFRPLYKQVRDLLTRRLAEGFWAPGAMLPSEQELAASLSVSQGTVRKALDAMAAENLIVRRQGRGTFVARQDDERVLFHFFRITGDDGSHVFPESEVEDTGIGEARPEEAAALGLPPGATVVRIRRTRSLGGRPVIAEHISLPAETFAGMENRLDLPNNLYGIFAEKFGVSIARTSERLKAVAADGETARQLGIETGTPLLAIERTAYSVMGAAVEWRRSLCLTDDLHYASDMR
ncbi:GntR family transcriptional regulator [Amorphus orientalis]|uniref:GntR family transcriptional regulator n=1 Tax=Amorphus orientalis TaxID=649198 RepID=A0AAE3VKE7_9HYPH|nr:GntR family transcriptional regulator [Amorphus orientalis]MDQ0313652.1 GntR family transcriptional regulator [Amorphus orientalis]